MTDTNGFIGQQIGNYRVVSKLNSGAFGNVYRAHHIILRERIVAIKLLHAYLGAPKQREQFLQEAQFLEKLKHVYCLPLLDVGIHDGLPYLVSEYAPKGSLRDYLKRQLPHSLSIEEAFTILSQIGQALQHAHQQNIIHRDLKPENVLFNAKGDALLADFGIAIVLATSSVKQVDTTGSPAYMAPEQFRGMISKESDQYALGCIAYELFTGHQPFAAPDFVAMGFLHATEAPIAPTQYNPDLPIHIEQTILKAMAKQRTDRHRDISAFINALCVFPSQTRIPTALSSQVPTVLQPGTPGTFQKTKEQWLNEGKGFHNLQQYKKALEAFEQTIRLDPTSVEAHLGKANALYELNRYEEALVAFKQTIRFTPTSVEAYLRKADTLFILDRSKEALAAYEQVIRLDPISAGAYLGKANALCDLAHYEEALAVYEQAIQLNPESAAAYLGKADTLYELKKYEEALAAYEQAIRLDPTSIKAYLGRGDILYILDRSKEALVAYKQAIRLDPESADAHLGKADALYDLACYEEALTTFVQAIRLDPESADAHLGKGNALYALDYPEEALAAFEQAIWLNPELALAHKGKGDVLQYLGRAKAALQAYEKAQKLGYKD